MSERMLEESTGSFTQPANFVMEINGMEKSKEIGKKNNNNETDYD